MNEIKRFRFARLLPAVSMVFAVALSGCGDEGLFDVKNPGAILDEDLNSARGVDALVVGMSSDYSASFDGQVFLNGRGGDEMTGGGSYYLTGEVRRGLIISDDVDGFWEGAQRARWVAEAGLERMKEIGDYEFNNNPLTARAYLFAGLANRWLGENFCYTVFSSPYEGDTGEALGKDAAFQRSIGHYEQAISHGGSSAIATAAKGALAQSYVGLGNWGQAATYAAQVPIDFVYNASYSLNSGREENVVVIETHQRAEMSVYNTYIATLGPDGDPRVPWFDCTTPGTCAAGHQGAGDKNNLHYKQMKYPDYGADIPLVKGTEMRLIQAEAALRNGDWEGAMAFINQVRTHHGLDELTATGAGNGFTYDWDSMTAWDILDREYLVTNWLEGRRLFQFHRWDQEGMTHPYLTGKHHMYELVAPGGKRFTCYPIADSECQTNEKVANLCI
jgi:hypothetical protein